MGDLGWSPSAGVPATKCLYGTLVTVQFFFGGFHFVSLQPKELDGYYALRGTDRLQRKKRFIPHLMHIAAEREEVSGGFGDSPVREQGCPPITGLFPPRPQQLCEFFPRTKISSSRKRKNMCSFRHNDAGQETSVPVSGFCRPSCALAAATSDRAGHRICIRWRPRPLESSLSGPSLAFSSL